MTTKEQQEKIQQLQLIEQNLQNLLGQKQQFQSQMFELDGALKEIEVSPQAYKIIGGIMVLTEKEKLKKDLSEKKELVELRISSIEKQEKQFKDRAKDIQQEVLSLMKEKK
jgi:prefoldin beta subunit